MRRSLQPEMIAACSRLGLCLRSRAGFERSDCLSRVRELPTPGHRRLFSPGMLGLSPPDSCCLEKKLIRQTPQHDCGAAIIDARTSTRLLGSAWGCEGKVGCALVRARDQPSAADQTRFGPTTHLHRPRWWLTRTEFVGSDAAREPRRRGTIFSKRRWRRRTARTQPQPRRATARSAITESEAPKSFAQPSQAADFFYTFFVVSADIIVMVTERGLLTTRGQARARRTTAR